MPSSETDRRVRFPLYRVFLVLSVYALAFSLFHYQGALGYAIAAVQLLPPGTYIAINGQLLDPRIARKNIDRNRFEINQY